MPGAGVYNDPGSPCRNAMSAAVTEAPRESLRRDAAVISLVGFAHGTSHFFAFVMPPLFPWLMAEFALSFTQVGLAMMVFYVVSGAGQAFGGFAVDRFGALRVLCVGVALLALGAAALAAAPTFAM